MCCDIYFDFCFYFFIECLAKIGVVDFQRIFKNSSAGKALQAELKSQFNKMQAELEIKKSEIEEIQKNVERQASVMSKDVREEKKRELQIKIYDFKNLEYLIIIDKSVAIYVPKTLDLTDKVIQEYNAGYKK
ncbi:MAG: OmpH family outer membrane protein [Deltaproteobacteria bacterium]|nr:OmpH family outer membrane protein [Deltaproteobacteria bacterium]